MYDHNVQPAESVAMAREALTQATGHAQRTAELLPAAQLAINAQGYNTPTAPPADIPGVTEPTPGPGGRNR